MKHILFFFLAVLGCTSLLAGCCGPAWAEGPASLAEDWARDLAAEVLRQDGGGQNRLGEWTRSVIERALMRAGGAAAEGVAGSSVPLPAESQAAAAARSLGARGNGAEVVVFTSLAVPAASWRQWAREAAQIGAPLVLRGVANEGLQATVREIGDRLGGHEAGVAIDPRLFRLFGIGRVPAVAVVPGGIPPCASRGCADDPLPAFDLVTGNIGLAAALEAIAAEGDAGRDTARRELARLRGEAQ